MNLSSGTVEIDLHNMNCEEAIKAAKRAVKQANGSVYTVRLIHGFNGGTRIKNAILDEFGYGREPKVIRVKPGNNLGVTDLVLREL